MVGTSFASLAAAPNRNMTRFGSTLELDATSLAKAAESGDNILKLAKNKRGDPELDITTGYVGWADGNAEGGTQSLKSLGKARER